MPGALSRTTRVTWRRAQHVPSTRVAPGLHSPSTFQVVPETPNGRYLFAIANCLAPDLEVLRVSDVPESAQTQPVLWCLSVSAGP